MITSLPLFLALALQSAPMDSQPPPDAAAAAPMPFTSLDELPIEQAAAPRCAFAFALVSHWQKADDPRGAGFADMEAEGGREFFVRTMAGLMDATGMNRDHVATLTITEVSKLDNPAGEQRIAAMMPACLLLKQSAGL